MDEELTPEQRANQLLDLFWRDHLRMRHPGVYWQERLIAHGRTQRDVAEAIGCSEQYLSNILCGHRLPSAKLTLRFAEEVGVNAERLWHLQANYVLQQAEQAMEEES